jgi:hypothetical protein
MPGPVGRVRRDRIRITITVAYPLRNVEHLHYVPAVETLYRPAGRPLGFSVISVEGWSWVGSGDSSHVLQIL